MTDMHREGFEKAMRDFGHVVCPGRDGYEYSSMAVEYAWQGWQAALRYRDEQEKGYALVPIEPTEAMLDACIAAWQKRLADKARRGTLLNGGDPRETFRVNWKVMIAAHDEQEKQA